MARDQIDMTPIETRDELVAWLEAGCKPKAQFRVGTEHEKFAFTVQGHRPVPYAGPCSIRALLEGLHDILGWELMSHLAQVREVAKPLGIGFLGMGMTPNWTRADMPMMPKGRYRIMTNYM